MLKRFLMTLTLLFFMLSGRSVAFAQNDPLAGFLNNLNQFADNGANTAFCWWFGCPIPQPTPGPGPCGTCEPGLQIIPRDDDLIIPTEEFGYILPFGVNPNNLVLVLFDEESNATGFDFEFGENGLSVNAETTAQLTPGLHFWALVEQEHFNPDASFAETPHVKAGVLMVVDSIPEGFAAFADTIENLEDDPSTQANAYALLSQINAAQWQFADAHQNAAKAFDFAITTGSEETIYNTWLLNENFVPPPLRSNQYAIIPGLTLEDVSAEIRNMPVEELLFPTLETSGG